MKERPLRRTLLTRTFFKGQDLFFFTKKRSLKNVDFQCFSKVNTDVNTFDCTIFEAYWTRETTDQNQMKMIFTISANRFLRNMVRAIVGTLLEVGKGKITLEEFKSIVAPKVFSIISFVTAPGLKIEGLLCVQLIIVDSTPTKQGPPSKI